MSSDRLTDQGLTNVNTSWPGFTPFDQSQAVDLLNFRRTSFPSATNPGSPHHAAIRKQNRELRGSGRSLPRDDIPPQWAHRGPAHTDLDALRSCIHEGAETRMGMVWRSCYRGGFHTPRPSVESPGPRTRRHGIGTHMTRTTSYDMEAGPPEPPARQCRIDARRHRTGHRPEGRRRRLAHHHRRHPGPLEPVNARLVKCDLLGADAARAALTGIVRNGGACGCFGDQHRQSDGDSAPRTDLARGRERPRRRCGADQPRT